MRLPWIAVIAGLAVVVAAFSFFSPGPDTTESGPIEPPKNRAMSPAPPQASNFPAPAQAQAQKPPVPAFQVAGQRSTLPPLHAPLRDHYEALKARAESGDVGANCRLAFELTRCSGLPNLRRRAAEKPPVMDSYLASLLHPDERERRQRAAEQRIADAHAAVQQLGPICEGLPAQATDGAWRYLLRASEAGHLPSMIRFVARPPMAMGPNEPLASLDGWIAYRDHAANWLARAIDAGGTPGVRARGSHPLPW